MRGRKREVRAASLTVELGLHIKQRRRRSRLRGVVDIAHDGRDAQDVLHRGSRRRLVGEAAHDHLPPQIRHIVAEALLNGRTLGRYLVEDAHDDLGVALLR